MAAGDRADPFPQAQQQIDPLVLDEPSHGHEQRFRRASGRCARLLHAVVDDPDAVALDADRTQRVGCRRGDGDQQAAALPARQCPVFESSSEPGGGGQRSAEPHPPQVGVYVVDQAQGRSSVPQRRQVRHAVADLDEQVAVADLSLERRSGAQVVAEVAARRHDTVVAVRGGAAAQQGDLVAEVGQALGESVDEEFGAARCFVAVVTTGEENDSARLWGERRLSLRGAGKAARNDEGTCWGMGAPTRLGVRNQRGAWGVGAFRCV